MCEEQHEYSTIIKDIMDNPKSSPSSYVDEKYPIVVETVNILSTPKESK
jgi:hypothetical protein